MKKIWIIVHINQAQHYKVLICKVANPSPHPVLLLCILRKHNAFLFILNILQYEMYKMTINSSMAHMHK